MAGMFVGVYVVQILLRIRTDEAGGTLESVLATGVSRPRWVLGYVLNAAAGAVMLVLLFGGTATQVRELAAATLVQLPGILALGAAVLVVLAVLPRWAAPVSWALVVASFVIGPMFVPGLGLPQWVLNLSPFTHTPLVHATGVSLVPLLVLSGACVALGVAGVMAIRRRNVLLPA